MNKKTKIIIIVIIAVIAVLALAIGGYIALNGFRQEAKLRREAEKLSEMDITKDVVDMEIKTKGDYAVVEKTMKDYINTYSNTLKDLEKILEDEKISDVLSAENYKNDGPEFTQTKTLISETKTNFNISMDKLMEMTSEEEMMKAIEDKNLSQEYVDLYKELMLGTEMSEDLKEAYDGLKEASETINNILDTEDLVINMLLANRGKWSISDDGQIEFTTQALVDQYNNYLSQLQ